MVILMTADAASLIDVIFEGTDLQFSLDQFLIFFMSEI